MQLLLIMHDGNDACCILNAAGSNVGNAGNAAYAAYAAYTACC
jgi:hypothetical protein